MHSNKYTLFCEGNPNIGHNKLMKYNYNGINTYKGVESHPVRGGYVTPDTGADLNKQRGPEEATPVHSPYPPPRPVVPRCEGCKYKVGAAEREKGRNTGADLPPVYKPVQKTDFGSKHESHTNLVRYTCTVQYTKSSLNRKQDSRIWQTSVHTLNRSGST